MRKFTTDKFTALKTHLTNYLALFLIGLLGLTIARNITKMKQGEEIIAKEQERLEEVKKENERLKEEAQKVQSEEFIEKQLRDKLGLAKIGEITVILPEEDIVRRFAPKADVEEETLPDPNWKKWMKLFL